MKLIEKKQITPSQNKKRFGIREMLKNDSKNNDYFCFISLFFIAYTIGQVTKYHKIAIKFHNIITQGPYI